MAFFSILRAFEIVWGVLIVCFQVFFGLGCFNGALFNFLQTLCMFGEFLRVFGMFDDVLRALGDAYTSLAAFGSALMVYFQCFRAFGSVWSSSDGVWNVYQCLMVSAYVSGCLAMFGVFKAVFSMF